MQLSMFNVFLFNDHYSIFNGYCSILKVQWLMFNINENNMQPLVLNVSTFYVQFLLVTYPICYFFKSMFNIQCPQVNVQCLMLYIFFSFLLLLIFKCIILNFKCAVLNFL